MLRAGTSWTSSWSLGNHYPEARQLHLSIHSFTKLKYRASASHKTPTLSASPPPQSLSSLENEGAARWPADKNMSEIHWGDEQLPRPLTLTPEFHHFGNTSP